MFWDQGKRKMEKFLFVILCKFRRAILKPQILPANNFCLLECQNENKIKKYIVCKDMIRKYLQHIKAYVLIQIWQQYIGFHCIVPAACFGLQVTYLFI